MAQFATTADLADFLGVQLDAAEQWRASTVLELASAAVQAAVKQQIEHVTGDVVTLSGDISDTLELPQRPVTAVTAVTLDGTTVTDHTWTRTGLLRRDAGWGGPGSVVQVTYSHGYTVIPADIRTVTVACAARVWNNPSTVVSESVGNYSVTYGMEAGSRGLALTSVEKDQLSHYRRTSGSIRVGRG